MVSIFSLWLPILLSAAAVFLISWLAHAVLRFHERDVRAIPDERRVADALRPFAIPPGDYVLPHANDLKEMGTPEFIEKMEAGPVAILTVLPNRRQQMGSTLVQWFLYSVVVGALAGQVAGLGHGPGAAPLDVFRVVGLVAFAGYALGLPQQSIWWGRGWGATIRTMLDGLAYSVATASLFVWLWP